MIRFKEGDVVTIKTMAQMLNTIPIGVTTQSVGSNCFKFYKDGEYCGLINQHNKYGKRLAVESVEGEFGYYDYTIDGIYYSDWMLL